MTKKSELKKTVEAGSKIKHKLYRDLILKAKDQQLTPTETKQFLDLEHEFGEKQRLEEHIKKSKFVMRTKDIAAFFDLAEDGRQIRNWNQAGCPKIKYGWYDLKLVHDWWLENIYDSKVEETDETIRMHKREYAKYQAKKMRLEVEKTEGSLILEADVLKEWCERVAEVKKGLLYLGDRIAGAVVGMTDRNEIKQVIDREARDLLEAYSRNGTYTGGENE